MPQAQFIEQHFVRVDDGFNHFVHADFILADLLDQGKDFCNGARTGGNRLHHVFQGVFDFFGNDDFVFTGQQVNLPHFTHIHTHGVGGSAELGIRAGQGGFGFGNGIVVGYGGGVVAQQNVFCVRRLLGNLDTQAGNHADDVVDLIRIGHIVGQGVVDFGISDVAAFLTHDDELAQTGALLFEGQRTVVVLFLIVFVILVFRHGLLS